MKKNSNQNHQRFFDHFDTCIAKKIFLEGESEAGVKITGGNLKLGLYGRGWFENAKLDAEISTKRIYLKSGLKLPGWQSEAGVQITGGNLREGNLKSVYRDIR